MKFIYTLIACTATLGSLPALQPCNNWSFSSDSLFWRVCEDGLAYGTISDITATSTEDPTGVEIQSRVKNIHPKWDMGYRFTLAYNLPCDCWGVALTWTHFNTHTRTHTEPRGQIVPGATEDSVFTPAWGFAGYNTGSVTTIRDVEAHWKISLDTVDIELGRIFCMSDCVTLRPHIGVRAAWINQSFKINTFGTDPNIGVDFSLQNQHLKSDFTGAGLRGGLDSQWELGCGLSLYGKAAAAVLYGKFDVDSEDSYRIGASGDAPLRDLEQKDEFCACCAVTDLALGLSWINCFCDNTIAWTTSIGWEHHLFFKQNRFEDFQTLQVENPPLTEDKNPQRQRGCVSFSGLILSSTIDF
ncbi:MAG: hypothetical protein H0X51_05560 [Parachlamydiaceae bacterium]|nr:hypothetical protein [Parachlamydiaceae bacterium]